MSSLGNEYNILVKEVLTLYMVGSFELYKYDLKS